MRARHTLVVLLLAAWGCGGAAPDTGLFLPPTHAPREQVENPLYSGWAAFPVGTAVVLRAVTAEDGHEGKTVTTTTYRLVERTEDRVAVEMKAHTRRYDGQEVDNPAEKFVNLRLVSAPPAAPSQPKQGEETLTIGGGSYRTTWVQTKDRNEGGEVLVQTWTSADVPGGIVRSVLRTPAIGKTTTTELVEVRKPQ